MATDATALQRLEDQLICSLCGATYFDPKQLQCSHVYCKECLLPLVHPNTSGQLSLTCPDCSQITHTNQGVEDLEEAFCINQLLKVVKRSRRKMSAVDLDEGCPDHVGTEMELYCETCGDAICWKCIMNGGRHHSHEHQELEKVLEKHRQEILSMLEPMEKQLTPIKWAQSQLRACQGEISDQQISVEAHINSTFEQLHAILDSRKSELIAQLNQLAETKLKALAAQRDQLQSTSVQLSSCVQVLTDNLKSLDGETLLMQSKVLRKTVNQVQEMSTAFQSGISSDPVTSADMIFTSISDLADACKSYGEVLSSATPDPSKCCITSKEVCLATLNEVTTLHLLAQNSNSEPCRVSTSHVSCEAIPVGGGGPNAKGSVKRKQLGICEISYRPSTLAHHQLHIKVNDAHIRGSPFLVSVRPTVKNFDVPVRTISGMQTPVGVAIKHTGEVVTSEWSRDCVTLFSYSGKKLRSFGTHGCRFGQFQGPHGVAIDGDGNILVADNHNHRIQKFTMQGEFLEAVGRKGVGPLHFENPSGIAYNANSGWIYVSCWNCSIQILNPDLTYLSSFGSKGSGLGQFSMPMHIACDNAGLVYVTDCGNNRIQVFTANGEFVRLFGNRELGGPGGITIANDRVYVTEWDHHRVSQYTTDGQFLTTFGKMGRELGEFNHPRGLAVDMYGVVYVCDCDNSRIQLF